MIERAHHTQQGWTRAEKRLTPAAASMVGKMSSVEIRWSDTVPAGIIPARDHMAIPGTRTPPSHVCPFDLRTFQPDTPINHHVTPPTQPVRVRHGIGVIGTSLVSAYGERMALVDTLSH
jgi:hypothetical protein